MPLAGKRVAVIGTGSSGVQCIPEIAKVARQLYVFQRTPNYVVAGHNAPQDPSYEREVKSRYAALRSEGYSAFTGYWSSLAPSGSARPKPGASALHVPAEEREAHLEALWQEGGLGFLGNSYSDVMASDDANRLVSEFFRGKIRQIVCDPAKAELLCPHYFIGCRRLCVGNNYFETFNLPNVTLVDISTENEGSTPITRITERGIQTSDGREHAVDAIIFALGYDAMTGALLNIDVTGHGGQRLRETWKDGPRSYMGLSVSGFPNLFTVTGPGSPSVLTNMVPSIEQHVDWIVAAIEHMRDNGFTRVEADRVAEEGWMQHCQQTSSPLLFSSSSCRSWYAGHNVAGKPQVLAPYAGGLAQYSKRLRHVTEKGYVGYKFA